MKNNMLSILLAASVISSGVLSVEAYAEDVAPKMPSFGQHMDPVQMRQKMQQKMAEELGLTAEQQKQAEALSEKSKAEMEPLMQEMKDIRVKMDEKRRANMEEFEKILTPEQKEKFEALKNEKPRQFIGTSAPEFPHPGKNGAKMPPHPEVATPEAENK